MWIIQRELDNYLSGFLVGTIGMDVILSDLAFQGLNPTLLDQTAVAVDRVACDTAEASDTLPSRSANSKTSSFF